MRWPWAAAAGFRAPRVRCCVAAVLLALGCHSRAGRAPSVSEDVGAVTRRSSAAEGASARELAWILAESGRRAAREIASVALLLPAGARDGEVTWLLDRGDPGSKGRIIGQLDIPEVVRLRHIIRASARSFDPRDRDPALLALARAGEIDVLPLLDQALRVERSEGSLADLAAAAAALGTLAPVDALRAAIDRARGGRALLAITEAIGAEVDAGDIRVLAARGPAGAESLANAVRALRSPRRTASFGAIGITSGRGRDLIAAAGDPRSAAALESLGSRGITIFCLEQMLAGDPVLLRDVPVQDPGRDRRSDPLPARAIEALRAHAAEVIDAQEICRRAAVDSLAARVRGRGAEACDAAAALGNLRTPRAMTALASALFEVDRPESDAISAPLAAALGVAPERRPEDVSELRRLWAPIVAALVVGPSDPPPLGVR